MNGLFRHFQQLTPATMPPDLEVLSPPPLLLPGESLEQYELLRQAIFADIVPSSAIEWLLAIDVAELSWEIRRYRILRHKLLEAYRQKAIEAALRRIDLAGILPEFEDDAEYYTLQNALSWRFDPIAANEIEARLASYGFDQQSINMEVYGQAREMFVLFEGLINAAQTRRWLLLKELNNQRYAGRAKVRPRAAQLGTRA